ncbi:hypothetical protein EK904_009771 [Melospiza melodia maxima]|nr:hypothetical protein EK904_009771 [Melospiza melodia maxima]
MHSSPPEDKVGLLASYSWCLVKMVDSCVQQTGLEERPDSPLAAREAAFKSGASTILKTPMAWLMKYCCFHIAFSEKGGSEKLVWKVSEKKLIAHP